MAGAAYSAVMEMSHDSSEIHAKRESDLPMMPDAGGRFASAIPTRKMSSTTR